jgi:hypothetical protein
MGCLGGGGAYYLLYRMLQVGCLEHTASLLERVCDNLNRLNSQAPGGAMALELFQLRPFVRRQARPLAAITLGFHRFRGSSNFTARGSNAWGSNVPPAHSNIARCSG